MDASHFLKISTETGPHKSREEVGFDLVVRGLTLVRDWPDWWGVGYPTPPLQHVERRRMRNA